LNKLIEGAYIMRCLEAQRLKWRGHLHRMEEYRMVRRTFEWSPRGKRSKGHQRDTWQDEVLKNIRVLGVKN
jgi:hypothetical protein